MERRIEERFHADILAETAGRYDLATADVSRLAAEESFIYGYERDGSSFILRITHTIRRTVELIRGEVDWMAHLHRRGAGVAQPVLSPRGQLVETVDDGRGGQFLATAFHKAPGGPPSGPKWNEAHWEDLGRVIGRMHRVTRDYTPSDPAWTRLQWDDPEMLYALTFLPESEEIAKQRFLQVQADIRALPKTRDNYGLIHQDAHSGNYFVDDEGCITFFDFDDCAYSWFANDVAITLFYAALFEAEPVAFATRFLTSFLRGYRRETDLDAGLLEAFPLFLKLREIDLYGVIHRSFDVENIDDAWVARFMEGRRQRIDDDVPVLDMDFRKFA